MRRLDVTLPGSFRTLMGLVSEVDAANPSEDCLQFARDGDEESQVITETALLVQIDLLLSDERGQEALDGLLRFGGSEFAFAVHRLRFARASLRRVLYTMPHRPVTPERVGQVFADVSVVKRAFIECALEARGEHA